MLGACENVHEGVRESVRVCGRGSVCFIIIRRSENEEELNCVSHFSFPCFSGCQEKAPHFLNDGSDNKK